MGLFLIYMFLSSDVARASDADTQVIEISAICASSQMVLTTVTENVKHRDVVKLEAEWWYGFLQGYVGDPEAERLIDVYIGIGQANLKSGRKNRGDLVELGMKCLEIRGELEVLLTE